MGDKSVTQLYIQNRYHMHIESS